MIGNVNVSFTPHRAVSANRLTSPQASASARANASTMGLNGFKSLLSRATPSRSDDELKEAVRLQAQQDAAVGIFQGDALHRLREEFISPVSPDRRGIISSQLRFLSANWNGGTSRVDIFHQFSNPSGGGHIASFIPGSGWVPTITREEGARQQEILRIYAEAWNAARFGTDGNRTDDNRPLNVNHMIDATA